MVNGIMSSEKNKPLHKTPHLKNVILVTAAAVLHIADCDGRDFSRCHCTADVFHIPIKVGSMLILVVVLFCEFTNAYKRIEKLIMLFVSLIGFCFLVEICMVKIDWELLVRVG